MKYRRVFLKAAAVVTAVSVALSGEGAAFSAVYAGGGKAAGAAVSSVFGSADQNTLEKYRGWGKTAPANSLFCGYLTPFYNSYNVWELLAHMDPVTDNFIMTADAGDSGDLGRTESVDGTSVSDNSADKENEGGSDKPENPVDPETPDDPKTPETPDDPKTPETPNDPDDPETPEDPGTPEEPDISAPSDSVSDNTLPLISSLSENTIEEDGISLLADDGAYGTLTDHGTHGAKGDNLLWKYYADTKTLVICPNPDSANPGGEMKADYPDSNQEWKDYAGAIESVVVEKDVTSLSGRAFMNHSALKEVRLPESLSKLGCGVFQNNTEITSIWFDDGITGLQLDNSNGNSGIFQGCTNLQELHLPSALTSLKINGTSVAMFQGCTSLTELTIPGGIVTVPRELQLNMIPNLQTLTLGSGITAVEVYNSYYSPFPNSLEELNLPRSFQTIQENMCKGLSKLQRINPASGVCQVNFPEGLKTIGNNAFSGCSLLGTAGEGDYTGMVRFPASLSSIGNNAFSGNPAIRSIVMSDGAAEDVSLVIGASAFSGNGSLKSVHFGDGKKELKVSGSAFSNCSKLDSLHFPENLETLTVENNSYSGCTALEELYLPGSLKTVTQRMNLYYLPGLKKLTFGPGMETVEQYSASRSNLPSTLEELYLPEGFQVIPAGMCNGFANLKRINPVSGGCQINFPKGLREIGESAFSNCNQLGTEGGDGQIVVSFPKSLKQIGKSAFSRDSQLTGLRFDSPLDGELQIQQYAFSYCSGLAGELRLPDGLVDLGLNALQGTEYRTALWTPLTPFQAAGQNRSNNEKVTFEEIRFRGTDDRDEKQLDGKTVGWSSFYEVFIKPQTSNSKAPEKLYIDDTVKRLASDTFWKDFKEVTFCGKNVITLDSKGMFAAASASVRNLKGTYYVTKEGALYLLDENTWQAALAYCPPGVTTLTIPASIFVTDDLTGVYDKKYNGTYSVTSVLPHAIIEAKNLNEINADNPRQITLGMRAFADCPTLSRVNGVTTQKEANALFGAEGTSARKFAFVNTGLSPDEEPGEKGKPQKILKYKDGAGSELTIKAYFKDVADQDKYQDQIYKDGSFRLMTGEEVSFDIKVNTNADTKFRIYFQPSDSSFEGFIFPKVDTVKVDTTTGSIQTSLITGYDAVAGSYYYEFRLSAGATMSIEGVAGSVSKPALYPAQVDNYGRALNLSGGGDLCVWAELVQDTPDPSGTPAEGADDYMMIHWGTERTEYQLNVRDEMKVDARIDPNTGKPTFQPQYGSAFQLGSGAIQLKPDPAHCNNNFYTIDKNTDRWRGRDPVKQVCWRYTVVLPEGMEWKTAEEIADHWYTYSHAVVEAKISGDKRTLNMQFTDVKSDVGDQSYRYFSLEPQNAPFDQDIVVREDYDFFADSEIVYDCSAVVYYQFSEPMELAKKRVTEILKGMKPGEVTFVRSTGLDEEHRFNADMRGKRGCTVINTFWAHNASAAPAPTGLTEITDTLQDYQNGYLYLTAGQMADILLEENSAIRVREIEITDAVLYGADAPFYSGVTHTGTDGQTQINENLLNQYTEPAQTGAVLKLTAERDEDLRLQSVALSVNGGTPIPISLPADLTDKTALKNAIKEVMEGAGYRFDVASGLYRITWDAVPEAKKHSVNVLDWWEIGNYKATIKLDCQQAHHYVESDSEGSYRFDGFHQYSSGYGRRLLKADFAYEGRAEEGEAPPRKTQTSYSPRVRYQDNFPESVDNENISTPDSSVLEMITYTYRVSQGDAGSWIKGNDEYIGGQDSYRRAIPLYGGDFVRYQDTYYNKNNVTRTELLYGQTLTGQALLAPCSQNPDLADKGYAVVQDPVGDSYYAIVPDGTDREISGVWLGYRDSASEGWNVFYAEKVTLCAGEDGTAPYVKINWYDHAVDEHNGKEYRILAQVLNPDAAGKVPEIKSFLYENEYLHEEDKKYSARLVVEKEGVYRGDEIKKDILKNPETLDSAPQEQVTDTRRENVYISMGDSITYRLTFDEFWDASYTLSEKAICDKLPDTAGCFKWEVGKNVHVRYLLHQRDGSTADSYQPYVPGTADFCRVSDEGKKGQYLYWGDFTIPKNHTLYIYVTLDFPANTEENKNLWDQYVKAVDELDVNGVLTNAFRMRTGKENEPFWEDAAPDITESVITHKLAKPPRAYLKTGKIVYDSYVDKTAAIYTNSDQEERKFYCYLVIYNDGESNLYLNPVHLIVPKGFSLDIPNSSYASYYNCNSISIIHDEYMTVTDGQLPPGVNWTQQVNVEYSKLAGEEADNGENREVVLELKPYGFGSGLSGGGYDDGVGKYYLEPGRYIAAKLSFVVGAYQETDGVVDLPAAMSVDNSLRGGTIEKVDDALVSAYPRKYPNAPGGTPLFFETDEAVKEKWGFDAPEDTTGKWVASEFSVTRAEAEPGLIKGMPVMQKEGEGEYPYKPQEGTAMEHPVKWETVLVNNGANALNDCHLKDSIQWPYVFDGEVKFSDNWRKESDKTSSGFEWLSFTITRYTEEVSLTQDDQTVRRVDQIDRDRLMVNGTPVEIAPDRETAMQDPGRYSAQVYGKKDCIARVWFYKENAFGTGNENDAERAAETMELDLSQRYYGTAPGAVDNNVVTKGRRTLSYWTRFDMSKMMENVGNTFINRALLLPGDSHNYHRGDVCEGIPLNESGNAAENDEEKVTAILASSHVTISVGQSTQGWIMAEENLQEGSGGLTVPDDVSELLSKNQTVLLSDTANTVTYSMGVLNQAVVVEDVPQAADERKYSLQDMVMINSLPHEGDTTFFQSDGVRGSQYHMSFAADSPDFDVKAYYYDSGKTTLHEVNPDYYLVLYSKKDSTQIDQKDGDDWKLQVDATGKDVPYIPPGWYTKADFVSTFGSLKDARSVRIEFVDRNDTFVKGGDNTRYRELMKPGRTIVVKYQAKVDGDPGPGKYAWNAFGYRFKRFADTGGEAFSSRAGVRIPTVPTLVEKLIDQDQDPFPNPGPDEMEFAFLIRKKKGIDGKFTPYNEQTIAFSVKLEMNKSENGRTMTRDEITQTVSGIVYTRQDEREFWQDGALYEVIQTKRPKYYPIYDISISGTPYEEKSGEFRYYSGAAPEIVYTNIHRQWDLNIVKKAEADGSLLKNALFGLYTEDADARMDEAALQTDPFYQNYGDVIPTRVMLNENTPLYLKALQVTGEDGQILWKDLEGEQYYVRELIPPKGCKLNTAYYRITPDTEMPFEIVNEPAPRLADTGGIGTSSLYMAGAGAVIVAVNVLYAGRRGRRRKKKRKNKNAGRTSGRAEKKAHIRACKRTFRRRKREILRQRRKAGRRSRQKAGKRETGRA